MTFLSSCNAREFLEVAACALIHHVQCFSLCAVVLCDVTGWLRRYHRGAQLLAQFRQSVDSKPRRVRAGQIHLLPAADHAARRAHGFHPGGGVRAAQLHPHLVGTSCCRPAGVCLVLFVNWHCAKGWPNMK